MKTELKIWIDYSSKEYGRAATREDEFDLFSSFQQAIGTDRVQQDEASISILDFSMDDLAVVKKTAGTLRIPVICKADDAIAKSELQRVRFALLSVEGDCIDDDSDGNPLNRYPFSLCPACNMPDENNLPEPFFVSAKQMLRRRQDGVPDEPLATKREIFHCSCGVFVITERVKRILEVLEQPFISARAMAAPPNELPLSCWAIQPARMWGQREHLEIMKQCPLCGRPQQCGADLMNVFWRNRIILKQTDMPDADIVCCETWFGNRTRRAADFIRDVFVSGRLYDVLLRAKIRGLLRPEEFVAVGNSILMVEDDAEKSWIKSKFELLKSESLVK